MKFQCSSTNIKISNDVSKFKSLSETPYDATCKSLNFDCKLACPICIRKIDIFCKELSVKCNKLRHLSDRAHCKQQ